MKRALVCIAILAFFGVATAQAALIDCSSLATLQALIDQNVNGGCISQDKIFSGFSYTGGGTQTANLITVHNIAVLGANDEHGWSFAPSNNQTWTTSFSLSYDITVAPGNLNVAIFESKDQINAGIRGGVTVVDTQTVGTMTMLGTTAETKFLGPYAPVTTIHTSSSATFSGGGLQSYEQDFFELTIPEPAPYFLLAGGLMLLGLVSKRFKKA